jgi:hypothetical protein
MKSIFVPSRGVDDWRTLLADPEKHWVSGYSARTLAYCWEDSGGIPQEITDALAGIPAVASPQPLLIFPEWKVALPGGSRASQNDVWVLARGVSGLISMAIEGKVNEPFDVTLGEWKADASRGKQARIDFISDVLGLTEPLPDSARYQLFHRTASAVLEAERFGARDAVMLVHSFSPDNLWFDDFALFASLYGLQASIGQVVTTTARNGMPLHLGWVHGNDQYLKA